MSHESPYASMASRIERLESQLREETTRRQEHAQAAMLSFAKFEELMGLLHDMRLEQQQQQV